jgi:hypothetical protein
MALAYSDTYAEARQKFLTLVADRGAKLQSVVHPERGAQGEELAMDVATFGDPDAEKTLLLVSGTHGQEGFYGSALQIAFLRDLDIPDGVNIVALHALNPWGFSHLSRSDHENIDVNRNFTEYGEPGEPDEVYAALFRPLFPDDWTEDTVDWTEVRNTVAQTFGMKRMATALSGGQSVEPTGLNYIGAGQSWSRRVATDLLPRVLAKSKKIAFIEWHTGLGDYGELTHACFMPAGSDGAERVFSWMGEAARTNFAESFKITGGVIPDYRGPFSLWLPTTAPQAEWAGLVIEGGTYETLRVADSLRMDRWLRFGSGRSSRPREEIRRDMLEGLYPSAPEWRAKALENGLDAQWRALRGLQAW